MNDALIIARSWGHRLSEWPLYNRFARELGAWVFLARALISFQTPKRLKALGRAYSLARTQFTIGAISKIICPYLPPDTATHAKENGGFWGKYQIGWDRYRTQLHSSPSATRTLILKAPGANGEKGVILSCFEYNWLRILSGVQPFEEFDDQYTLIFSTSASPTNYHILALALEKIPGPIFVIPCNYKEVDKLRKFHPRIHPLDLLACDWLNPERFHPKPWREREIDILMVSNWAPVKRHWHLFDILRKLPSDLRVVCVGQPEGEFTLEQIRKHQSKSGAAQNVEFIERIPIERVNELQCDAKIAIILSRWEGCCVAAVEGLMAGACLAMLDGVYVGPVDYINGQTGVRLKPGSIAQQIMEVLNGSSAPCSHEWAAGNISCYQSIDKLNKEFKDRMLKENLPWTGKMVTPCWNPFPCYVEDSDKDKMRPSAELLSCSYPTVFPSGWLENSRY